MFKIKLTTIYFIFSLLLTPIAYFNELVISPDEKPVIQATVTATMYNAVEKQCDSDPYITAAMYKINPAKASEHRWVALSRNLLKRWGGQFDYGDYINVSGAGHKDGIYRVADTMNKRYKNRIDFLETLGVDYNPFYNVIIEKVDL